MVISIDIPVGTRIRLVSSYSHSEITAVVEEIPGGGCGNNKCVLRMPDFNTECGAIECAGYYRTDGKDVLFKEADNDSRD